MIELLQYLQCFLTDCYTEVQQATDQSCEGSCDSETDEKLSSMEVAASGNSATGQVCEKQTKSSRKRRRKKFSCSLCSYKYSSVSHLQQHMKIHENSMKNYW